MKREMIAAICSAMGGMAAGAVITGIRMKKTVMKKQKLADKHLALYLMMDQWVKIKQYGKQLSDYFEREGYHEIAIYGMHYAGEALVEELAGSDIHIRYGIDQNAERMYADLDLVTPDAKMEKVDAVVVTPITFFDEIEALLKEKVDCPIISLEDILYQV